MNNNFINVKHILNVLLYLDTCKIWQIVIFPVMFLHRKNK